MPPPAGQSIVAQEDWSAGICRFDRRRIPPNGCWDLINWLLDDDGAPYKRGGSSYKSNASFGTTGLLWTWDGRLEPGARTVFMDRGTANPFGVLDADDATPIRLPLPPGYVWPSGAKPIAAELDNVLWITSGSGRPLMYAGSRKTALYNQGDITVTNGSRTVTRGGAGAWGSNIDAGMLLRSGTTERLYVVEEVVDNNTLKLTDEWDSGNKTNASYNLYPIAQADQDAYVSSKNKGDVEALGVAGRRLWVGDRRRLFFSKWADPHAGWTNANMHRLPQGAQVTGIAEVRGAADEGGMVLIFSNRGIWAISNIIAQITDSGTGDPQHRMAQLSGDIILWSAAGLCSWQESVVVPALDGVWIVGARRGPVRISDSILPLWQSYVRSGYTLGKAEIYREHYCVPILDSSDNVIDTLVCRLDRPIKVAGRTIWPWLRLDGEGCNVTAFAMRVPTSGSGRSPSLLGASRATAGRLLDLSKFWEPAAAVKNDHDGSNVTVEEVSRDYATGPSESLNTVRFVEQRYSLVADGADTPTLTMQAADSDGAWQTLEGTGEARGETGFKNWQVKRSGTGAMRTRYVRYRLTSSGPASTLTLRTRQTFVRQAAIHR